MPPEHSTRGKNSGSVITGKAWNYRLDGKSRKQTSDIDVEYGHGRSWGLSSVIEETWKQSAYLRELAESIVSLEQSLLDEITNNS